MDDAQLAAELQAEELGDDADADAAAANAAIQRQNELRARHGQNAANVIGQEVNYDEVGEIHANSIRAQQYQILCVACIMIPILFIIIIICEVTRRKGNKCGIPVQLWVEIIFIILLINQLLSLQQLWIIRYNRGCALPFMIVQIILVILAFAALTIWGYIIYFDDDNNCQDYSDTSCWLVFMIIFLFFGTFLLLLLLLLCICGPILYCYLRDQMKPSGKLESDGQINQVINKLQRTQFDPRTMTAETKCCICYCDFEPGDKVTQLKCNEAHLFHTDCIIEWIGHGENTCPICRAPIENVDDLRAMMEGGELDGLLDNMESNVDDNMNAARSRRSSQRQNIGAMRGQQSSLQSNNQPNHPKQE